MLKRVMRYLYPHRRLHRVPRRITATYERDQMSIDAQLMMMAGLARDPADARRMFAQLQREHGDRVYEHIELQVRRQRASTARERFWMLVRRMIGEGEFRRYERRREAVSRVQSNYRHRSDT